MRVLFYVTSFLPKCDGISYCLKTLIDHWDYENDQLYLMTPNSIVVDGYPNIQEIIKVPGDNYLSKKIYPEVCHTNLFRLPRVYSLMKNAIKKHKIDVVHVLGPEFIGFFFCFLKTPAIHSYHTDIFNYIKKSGFFRKCLGTSLVNIGFLKFVTCVGYRFILSPSPSFLDRMIRQKLVNKNDLRLKILPATLESSLFYSDQNELRDSKSLIFVGRIAPEKNLDFLFDAMHLLEGYTLIVAGNGTSLSYFRKRAQEDSRNEYIFLGQVEREHLVKYYSRSRFFINPSSTETFGFTTIEAIGCGTIPLVFPAGGSLDIVQDQYNGCFIRTPEDIVECIEKINTEDSFYQTLLENGKKTFGAYDIKKSVRDMRAIYKETIEC